MTAPASPSARPYVEAIARADLPTIESAWRDLAARAAVPNPFAESAFAVPAATRIGPRGLLALAAWDEAGRRTLNGLALIRPPGTPYGIADVWRSDQSPLSPLLFDNSSVTPTLEAMLGRLASAERPSSGLAVSSLDVDGPIAAALRSLSERRGLRLTTRNLRRRAALRPALTPNFRELIDARRRKEWGRLHRRMAERGEVAFTWSDAPDAITDFLWLESIGWKGARRTALTARDDREAFTREMLQSFATVDRLRIGRLTLDGRAIAAGVVLLSGDQAFYWKTAYDEAFADLSPGVHLTLAMSDSLVGEPELVLVDSCADADHPMINPIWPARIELADFVIATGANLDSALSVALAARNIKSRLREGAKRLVTRLRAKKR